MAAGEAAEAIISGALASNGAAGRAGLWRRRHWAALRGADAGAWRAVAVVAAEVAQAQIVARLALGDGASDAGS